jgi:hypothetical protein
MADQWRGVWKDTDQLRQNFLDIADALDQGSTQKSYITVSRTRQGGVRVIAGDFRWTRGPSGMVHATLIKK